VKGKPRKEGENRNQIFLLSIVIETARRKRFETGDITGRALGRGKKEALTG